MVNGMQMTIVWHVDDLKVSHKDGSEITNLLIYGPGIAVNQGRQHDYLGINFNFSEAGINFNFSEAGVAKLSMTKKLGKIFKDFLEEIGKACSAPASKHLFEPPEEIAQHFHHTVAQLLYASTRVRPDIQMAVAFLMTRVEKPDEDDWGKLKRVLKYLKGTRHMSRA
eukprot:CCRYP_017817-RA/>CCRYP_017817-RA protein AED:0.43 eAED:0.44 QI:0/0/0/1/0/0/3/0/166